MMTKKIFATFVASSIAFSSLMAENIEDFFYEKGFEAGWKKGFEAGAAAAFEEAKLALKKYDDDLKAYEIGKYLTVNKNLTYPQVWQESTADGSFKLKVLPSKIEKQINIDELFTRFSNLPLRSPETPTTLQLSANEKNSVYLSSRDNNYNSMPQTPGASGNLKTLSVEKNSKNLDLLKRANVVFSDEGNSYNVLFFTTQEKIDFCQQYRICDK